MIVIKEKVAFFVTIIMLLNTNKVFACTESKYTNFKTDNIKVNQIPDYLLEMIENYPETKILLDYYEDYLSDKDYHKKKDNIDEDLLTDEVPFFLQWDKRWAFKKYGNETVMATSGCGPTCLSMVINYFKKDNPTTPKQIADYSREQGHYIEHVGTKWDLIPYGGRDFGLKVQPLEFDKRKMVEALDKGKIIIANVGAGHFTVGGHYIVVKSHDGQGNFFVNDPNSIDNTKTIWPQDIIEKESKRLWTLDLP